MALFESIRNIAILLLQEEVIIASWGISNVKIFDSHICFHVNGLKYNGLVDIQAKDGEMFEILLNETSIGQCHLDNAVNTIDNAVEKTDYYQQDLEEWIKKNLGEDNHS